MAAKDIRFGEDALKDGARRQRSPTPVKATLGPKGRQRRAAEGYGAPTITKDGVSVAKEIELADAFEDMGAQMVKEVASKTSDNAGDGTTTATVLAQAFIREGMKAVAAGMNDGPEARHRPGGEGRGRRTEVAVQAVVDQQGNRPGRRDLRELGCQHRRPDRAGDGQGRQGRRDHGRGRQRHDNEKLNVVEGMQFDRGYLSPYFVNNQQSMSADTDDPSSCCTTRRSPTCTTCCPSSRAWPRPASRC
ncbi:TCP-1/cpn60 chaperonin family protein [Klebsiella pneumoniae]|uniref:TCP-1/cpn60 chaperonin family protein n=1 Tax=Klebsiella pneumoniae TaxID=573 RepID=UPI002949791C|nr:TCP-1/cpn60 chaperonin family protein [Klebsiella pneumoniae]MDV5417868.1 TCP-1/cpn60 chaperonin family protein [Klebsiella pneumoniae]